MMMMTLEILTAARALRAAQQHELQAEQAYRLAESRASITESERARAQHMSAIKKVEYAEDELLNVVMRALDAYEADASSITDTREMPAVEVSE